jgi:hypothetical protein
LKSFVSLASALAPAIAAGSLGGCSLVLAWSSLEGGATSGGADGGAAEGGARCDPTASFGTVLRIPGDVDQPNTNERGGRLSSDEGTLYFSVDHGDGLGFRIRAALRDDAGAFQTMPGAVLDAPDGSSDYSPFLHADGTTLYFERATDDGSPADHIYRATRSGPAGPFGGATEVTDLVGNGTEGAPFFSDDTTLYFVDSFNGGIPRTATRVGQSFTPPTTINNLPYGSGPVVTGDNLTLYYSEAAGTVSVIHRSTRTAPTLSWDTPTPVAELNDPQNDQFPTWVSSDGCVIVFERLYQGSYDLFWAHK